MPGNITVIYFSDATLLYLLNPTTRMIAVYEHMTQNDLTSSIVYISDSGDVFAKATANEFGTFTFETYEMDPVLVEYDPAKDNPTYEEPRPKVTVPIPVTKANKLGKIIEKLIIGLMISMFCISILAIVFAVIERRGLLLESKGSLIINWILFIFQVLIILACIIIPLVVSMKDKHLLKTTTFSVYYTALASATFILQLLCIGIRYVDFEKLLNATTKVAPLELDSVIPDL